MRRILASFLHKERKYERSFLFGRGSCLNFGHGADRLKAGLHLLRTFVLTVTRSGILNKKRPGLPGRLLTELKFCLERDASDDRALPGQLTRRCVQ